MAWNISKAKRQALVKLQLRDKEGKFIEMGGGVKWYSSRLKKVVAGTVVGTKGENALVRLNKENPTHEPALVTVPAASIIAIEGKASLAPKGEPSADQTPEFEKPEAVADVEADPNAEADSDHMDQLKGPQHLASNYGISETSDGNTYITRKDGESIYSPARALKVGDELIAPAGADPTKPFSIGRNWATKGTERLNKEGEGPVIGKVIAISENRYAVVQMAGGHTIADRRNPEEQTDTVTVGLSNQVILATMGLKDALGDRVSSQTYAERPSDEEKEVSADAPEAQSDHVGREVPEDQLEAGDETERRTQILRDMPVGGRVMSTDGMQTFEKRNSNQWALISGDGELITDDDVMGMVKQGEDRGMSYTAQEPADDSENAPESAPEQTEAPEAQPAPESPVEEAPEAVEEAPETEAPSEEAPDESEGVKATPINDIVDGLAELEQAAEDVESANLSGEEADEVLDGAAFNFVGADGKNYGVITGADQNGDFNFTVVDENGAEVASHIIGSEENRVLAERISNPTGAKKAEEAPAAAETTPESAPEATSQAPEAESYNENGLTEAEQRELTGYTRLASRSYEQFKDEEGDRYKALADELLARGEERKASAPAEQAEKAPESAPQAEEAPEVTPEPEKAPEAAPAPSLVEPDAAPEEAPAVNAPAFKVGTRVVRRGQPRNKQFYFLGQEDGTAYAVPTSEGNYERSNWLTDDALNRYKVPVDDLIEVPQQGNQRLKDGWERLLNDALEAKNNPEPDESATEETSPEAEAPADPDFSGSAKDLPIGSKVYSDDGLVQMTKHGDNQWTIDSRQGELIDNATVDAFVRNNQTNRGQTFKQSVPGGSNNSSEAAPNETPEAGSEENKPALNGEEGFTPVDGRGLKDKEAKEASPSNPFGISYEYRNGLDHPVASNPEAMNDEENAEFERQDIALSWAQHENRRGAEAIARGKLSDLERRVQSRIDSESMKRQRDIQNGDSLGETEAESNESEAPEAPESPAAEAPKAAPVVDPNANEDGLLPDEAARLADLENRQAAAFRGESNEDPASFDGEISELIRHGRLRGRGREVGPFVARNPAPEPASEQNDEPEATPAPEVSPEPAAPEAPATEAAPAARRTRNSEPIPVADADGNMITRGDKIGHPTLGPVEITNTIPGTGRIEFIDPTTGRKKSVKAARVRKIDPNAAEAAPEEQSSTVAPGERFVDAATGKQGFGDANGNRVLVGDRIRHSNGNTGTVKAVYTAGNGGAWPAITWDSDGEVRRAMGNVLEKDDSTAPEATPDTAPEPTPAEEPFEPASPSAAPAPEATPEAAPEAETHEAMMARLKALVDATPVNGKITSGSQNFYRISDSQWQFNEGNLLTPTAVQNMMALGERRGERYEIAEGRPVEVNNTPVVDIPAPSTDPVGPEDPNANTPGRRAQLLNRLRSMPIGTKVESRGGEQIFTKEGEDNWSSNVDPGSILNAEDISGLLLSGRARGLRYDTTAPATLEPVVEPEPTVLPTVTLANPQGADPVGDSITDLAPMERLDAVRQAPLGSVLKSPNDSNVFTKIDRRLYVDQNGTEITDMAQLSSVTGQNGPWTITTPTVPYVARFEPNTPLPESSPMLRALISNAPIGSVINNSERPVSGYVKTGNNTWDAIDSGVEFSGGSVALIVSGYDGYNISPPVPKPIPQDLESRQRVADMAPIGTVVTSSTGESYTKISDTQWADTATGNFTYFLGEFASKLMNNPYTGNYFVTGFYVPDIAPESTVTTNDDGSTTQPIPADVVARAALLAESPEGTTVQHERGALFQKVGPGRWMDTATGFREDDDHVVRWTRDGTGWSVTTPAPEPEAPKDVIHADLPVDTFLPKADGSTAGLKRVGPDKWEMIKNDGTPSGRFATDETVKMFQELIGTIPVLPVDPRFGEPLGFDPEVLGLPGGVSLGKFIEQGGRFTNLSDAQRKAISDAYDNFIKNLNTQLPAGYSADFEGNGVIFEPGGFNSKVAFYFNGRKLTKPSYSYDTSTGMSAQRYVRASTDARTGKRVSSVEHALFTLPDEHQGSGVSNVFLKLSKQMYRQMGLDRITIHADISVGGYAWARGGFDFKDRYKMAEAIKSWEVRSQWNIPAGREEEWKEGMKQFLELKAKATPQAFQNKTAPLPIHFANIGRPDGPTTSEDTWFGKSMMMGSDWYGEFPLNSDAPSATVAPSQ